MIRSLFLFGCVLFVVTVTNAVAQEKIEGRMDIDEFVKEYDAHEQYVLAKLKDENLWKKARNKFVDNQPVEKDMAAQKELLGYLRAAKIMRSAQLATVLVKHISYSHWEFLLPRPRHTMDMEFPVYGALKGIGVLAVPVLLDELKKTEDAKKKDDEGFAGELTIRCLIEIYDQGGFGKALAWRRIEFEADKATGKEKERLLKALQHPAFK